MKLLAYFIWKQKPTVPLCNQLWKFYCKFELGVGIRPTHCFLKGALKKKNEKQAFAALRNLFSIISFFGGILELP